VEFKELLLRQRKWIPNARVLAFDPGETTGMAFFVNGELTAHDQLRTKDLDASVEIIQNHFNLLQPDYIVMEDYKIYAWKKDEHTWATLHTPQLLGVIRTLAVLSEIPLEKRMAVEAKTFCDNDKLEMWGMYKPGMRHARDAIRHGCFSLLFSKHPMFTKPTKES